uniref:LRRCT domain-containing protein n=1 Tax=Eptatretus burgeri TaxID=7764 RepID=A0A8C4NKD4_EPTBU
MAGTLIFLVSLCTVLQQIQACPCDEKGTTCNCKETNIEILDQEIGSNFITLDFENTNLKKVKAGVFNKANNLTNIKLNGTKLVCDCDIMYLRSWLMKVSAKQDIFQARCSSPSILKNRLIAFLSNSEIECQGFCSWVIVSQSVLYAFLSVHGIIIMALVHYVRRKEKVDKNFARTTQLQRNCFGSTNAL